MTIHEILSNTEYKLIQFTNESLQTLERRIQERGGKYYVECLIRKKEIKLAPEEVVRQLYLDKLMSEYGYPASRIELEYNVTFGREKKRADIVIFDKDQTTTPYIIVELKKPRLKDGKEQLKSYCNATGAPIGVWTNGDQISFYHRKDPNFFEDIPTIPKANEKLSDILSERWTIRDLIKKDKLATERKSLKDLILEMEDEVLANAGVDVFEELFKLIFTKLYDEMQSGRDKKRNLEFRNYGDTETELKNKIQNLFNLAKKKWEGVFSDDSKIGLTPSHLSICVSSLQDVKLFNSNLEVVDEAFEYLINKSSKGEKGQYFTPRYVIDMCVRMLNPKATETMIDTASGSCGFPVHTIFYVWEQIFRKNSINKSHLFTLENKPTECTDYVNEKVFAIDFDERAVRVARTLNLIAGDGQTNVLHLNTLDWERWYEKTGDNKNPADQNWLDTYGEGWKRLKKLRKNKDSNYEFQFDILMANPPFAGDIKESRILAKYDLGKRNGYKYQTTIGRDILFIERNLDFLKPGGRMAIVLPQGRFNNSSDKYIREFIAGKCRILAVVGLHGNTFKPHTGTKTSVLFLQKWDDKLCPKCDDYPIFFATMQEQGKDNSGDKIYEAFLDSHGHLIVKHDLFNRDGLTQDGIAEAFIEFAKKEKLSFFLNSPFDKQKYKGLLEGLEITEIMLSELNANNDRFRFDAEFVKKEYLNIENKLKTHSFKTLKDIEMEVIHPTEIKRDFVNDGVWFFRTQNLRPLKIENSNDVFISNEDVEKLSRNDLKYADVLMTRTGANYGQTAIYNLDKKAIASSHILIFRNNFFNQYYLAVFFNTNYGRKMIDKGMYGAAQPEISPYYILNIPIPIFKKKFQLSIEEKYKESEQKLQQSLSLYRQAEDVLLETIGLKDFQPSRTNTNIKSFKESFLTTERLDAEYYQPKYEEIISKIKEQPYDRLENMVTIKKSIEPGSDVYCDEGLPFLRVSDYNKMGIFAIEKKLSLAFCKENEWLLNNLKPKKDTILFSKDGSVGTAYLLQENADFITSGAILHLIIKDKNQILPEYLTLVLNSPATQMQAERDAGGSIILHWRINEIENVIVPIIPLAVQTQISGLIQQSFTLRSESERLLEDAKGMVERKIGNKV